MRVRLRARIFNDFWYRLINGYFSPTLSLHILRDKEKFIIRELGRANTAFYYYYILCIFPSMFNLKIFILWVLLQ